jgi:hypothetical protein
MKAGLGEYRLGEDCPMQIGASEAGAPADHPGKGAVRQLLTAEILVALIGERVIDAGLERGPIAGGQIISDQIIGDQITGGQGGGRRQRQAEQTEQPRRQPSEQ